MSAVVINLAEARAARREQEARGMAVVWPLVAGLLFAAAWAEAFSMLIGRPRR